jgi:hypothetical protein
MNSLGIVVIGNFVKLSAGISSDTLLKDSAITAAKSATISTSHKHYNNFSRIYIENVL